MRFHLDGFTAFGLVNVVRCSATADHDIRLHQARQGQTDVSGTSASARRVARGGVDYDLARA